MNTSTTATSVAGQRDCGCPDFRLSRRRLLGGSAAGVGLFAATSVFGDTFREVAYGAAPGDNVVVVLSLRGGADGLSVVVPRNDLTYLSSVRPDLVVETFSGGNGSWGLHPALAPLVPMWDAGEFGVVHGVGLPTPNRSHFEAMELVELANPGSNERRGWINRLVGLSSSPLPEEQVQLGSSMLPSALVGPTGALGAYSVNDLKTPNLGYDHSLTRSLRKVWSGGGTSLNDGVLTALGAVGRLADVAATDLDPIKALYPDGPLRDVLANTATLIKADVGAKMITIDYGDWDMHTGLGRPEPGDANWMYNQLDHLAQSLKVFFDDLGAMKSKVTVVTISEFGRRVEQNGSGTEAGVDHGYGNVMLVLGGGVNGGDMRGSWTPLSDNSLNEGDVPLATDYRSVLWDVVSARYSTLSGQRTKVFPGSWSYTPTTIMH